MKKTPGKPPGLTKVEVGKNIKEYAQSRKLTAKQNTIQRNDKETLSEGLKQ